MINNNHKNTKLVFIINWRQFIHSDMISQPGNIESEKCQGKERWAVPHDISFRACNKIVLCLLQSIFQYISFIQIFFPILFVQRVERKPIFNDTNSQLGTQSCSATCIETIFVCNRIPCGLMIRLSDWFFIRWSCHRSLSERMHSYIDLTAEMSKSYNLFIAVV